MGYESASIRWNAFVSFQNFNRSMNTCQTYTSNSDKAACFIPAKHCSHMEWPQFTNSRGRRVEELSKIFPTKFKFGHLKRLNCNYLHGAISVSGNKLIFLSIWCFLLFAAQMLSVMHQRWDTCVTQYFAKL